MAERPRSESYKHPVVEKKPELSEEAVNSIYRLFNTEIEAAHREPDFDHLQRVIDVVNDPAASPAKEYQALSQKCQRMEEVREKLVDGEFNFFNFLLT